jgi:hypothetical protein
MPGLRIAVAVVTAVVIFLVVAATSLVDVQERRDAECAQPPGVACDDARDDASRAVALALAASAAGGVAAYLVTRRAVDGRTRPRDGVGGRQRH